MVAHDPERERTGPAFSLIFPTYNAASFVKSTFEAVTRFLQQAPGSWEALFVCDGCSDETVDRLTQLVRLGPNNVRLLSYTDNQGKGHAVREGMRAARGRWRIFTDVDLAYRFEDIVRVAQTLQRGADVAIASRLHRESRVVVPSRLQGYAYRRHIQSLVFSAVVRRLLPLRQRDTQAGLKGLSARAVDLLWPTVGCNGFGFDCELLMACRHHRVQVQEVPVTMHFDSRASTTSVRSMHRMLGELWAIRHAWRGKKRVPADVPAYEQRQAA